MLVSKISRFKFRVKHRIDNYIRENSDEISFEHVMKFCFDHYCFAANSFEDFMNYTKPKKRIIIIWTYYILMLFINLKFFCWLSLISPGFGLFLLILFIFWEKAIWYHFVAAFVDFWHLYNQKCITLEWNPLPE
jgi:cellulose synthase/poly-beta-1,6-N-acetylglucosamine synthase-like glycosyltransferase